MKVHFQVSARPLGALDEVRLYPWAFCGVRRGQRPEYLTRDRNAVTCRTCQRRMHDTWEARQERSEAQRRKQARRREAQRIVLERHADEVEMELAVLVLADLGCDERDA